MNAIVEKSSQVDHSWFDKQEILDYLIEQYDEFAFQYEHEQRLLEVACEDYMPFPELFEMVDAMTDIFICNIIYRHAATGDIDFIGYSQEECQNAIEAEDRSFDELYTSLLEQHCYSKSYAQNKDRLNQTCEHEFITCVFEVLIEQNITFSLYLEDKIEIFNSPLEDVW